MPLCGTKCHPTAGNVVTETKHTSRLSLVFKEHQMHPKHLEEDKTEQILCTASLQFSHLSQAL